MALAYSENFARVVSVAENRAQLAFELEHARWPWLSLPPQHPVLIEKYQYFGMLTGMWALSGTDPELQTALTQLSWRCPPLREPALAERGVCTYEHEGEQELLRLDLQTPAGELLCDMRAIGVVFATRDFAKWRAMARTAALDAGRELPMPARARPETVGLGPEGRALVSPLREQDGRLACTGFVGAEAFHPRHPFHTGSGDHVNAGHLFDCALQAAHLALESSSPRSCSGGEASFARYLELELPFEISVLGRTPTKVAMAMHQLGKPCAQIDLDFHA